MKRTLKLVVALLLVCVMLVPMFTACKPGNNGEDTTGGDVTTGGESGKHERVKFDPSKSYVFKDSVGTMAKNWNPHTYQNNDDAYPADFLRVGLYGFVFNDELHPSAVEGMEAYKGYTIIPEMAASEPVDVTEQIKALDNNKFGIPADATKGYAYTIDLNKDAVWEDGTPINADTYVYSMKQLLDPKLLNYRATDYYSGSFSIAGAEAYANGGHTAYFDNDAKDKVPFSKLTKGANGVYTWNNSPVYIGVNYKLSWLQDNSLKAYVEAYGDKYFGVKSYEALAAQMDENGLVPLTDDTYKLIVDVITAVADWGETADNASSYFVTSKDYPVIEYDGNVGLYKSGDYQITLVLNKSLSDFYLLYNLSGNWIVKQDIYDKCLSQDANGVWSSTYNTSVETTSSYGPYKLAEFVPDSSMRFVRNDKWYGYTDGKHTYIDPEDNKEYDMYMTTEITTLKVEESSTRKEMFLKGQLMGYGLQSDDFEQYRSSDYCYFTPDETIFFFIFNGYLDAIQKREANEGFDKTKYDLETLTLTSFRKGIAVSYDKEALCTAISPSRSGGYGIIGNNYIYDPTTGAKYRDTDYAKQALCDFYSVDVSKFKSLDEAVDSITGYDPVAAKEHFGEAFKEALEKGYITSKDGKTCDQTIEIEYATSESSSFITKTLDYLNKKLAEVLVGTPFEGKVVFKESAPLGNQWSNNIRSGMSDTVLGGWSGSALDPYSLTDLYCNPENAYDAKWFDAHSVSLTININGTDITMSMYDWSDALNGKTVKVNDKEYNFGYGQADTDTRLLILSKIEGVILQTYDYIPMLQNAGASLLSKQVYYVVEEYSSVMGRGGIAYMKYDYDETEWKAYVASQPNGQLSY